MITLETAKELKWEWETEKVYFKENANEADYYELGIIIGDKIKSLNPEEYYESFEIKSCKIIKAPSLEELLERMPHYIYSKKIISVRGRYTNEMFFYIDFMKGYKAYYSDAYSNELKGFEFIDTNPSEAVAKLRIKLRKEGLIK